MAKAEIARIIATIGNHDFITAQDIGNEIYGLGNEKPDLVPALRSLAESGKIVRFAPASCPGGSAFYRLP